MQKGNPYMGMNKHRTSGPASLHMTGPRAGKRVRRKGSTRKQRRQVRGTHVNRYANISQ